MAYIGSIPAYQASGVRPRDEFTADGTQICFPLSQSVPGSFESGVTIVLDNVPQQPVEAFTVVDTRTLTLTSITGTFTVNETVTGGTSTATGTVLKVNLGSIVIRPLTGTFSSSEGITGGSSSATATTTNVTINTGSGILFSEIPTVGSIIYVVHEGNATYNLVPTAASVGPSQLADNLRNFTVDTFTGDGTTTAFTLTDTPSSANALLVMVDGIVQTRTTNYTLATNVVTFTGAPDSGASITIIHLGFSTISRTGLVDGSVTTAKLADGSITAAKIADGTIIAADVAAGAITPAKLSTGGLFWDTSSNVGIGTASPSTQLQMNSGSTTYSDQLRIRNTNYGNADIGVGNGIMALATDMSNITFYTSSSLGTTGSAVPSNERVRIDSSGNVGVGTTSPVAKQHIKGSGTSGQTTASLIVENASSGTLGLDITGTAGSSYARLRYGGGPSTGTNAMTGDAAIIGLEGSSVGFQQIRFAATQVASANANTLDDYEEGTFTPNLVNNGGTSTWAVKIGRYTKVGALVNFWCYIDSGGPGSGGALILSGLPFTGSGSGSTMSTVGTIVTSLGSGSTSWYPAFQSSSSSDCVIWSGGSQVINQSFGYCVVQGCYNTF